MTDVALGTQLDVAAQLLELVREEAGAEVEAEVTVDREELALTRFANSFIHQNVADVTTSVRLRLHLDGRTAMGSSTILSTDGLRDLAARTVAASRLCPADVGWPGLAPPQPPTGTGTVDEATAAATPADRASRVRAFVDAGGGLQTAGYCSTRHHTSTFANSGGHSVSGGTTEAAMDAIVRTGGADGLARLASVRLGDLDGAVLGARAAAKARAGVDPIELPPGRYEVVLEPPAVADLLWMMAVYGFNGKTFNERRSFVEPGAGQFDAAVSLVDDVLGSACVGLPFDADGTPKQRVPFVADGISVRVAHDRRTAAEAGTESTGHALPGLGTLGAAPVNLTLVAAGDPAASVSEVDGPAIDSSVAALVGDVERGILVSDHWYTRVLDPRTLVVTGLTRNGVWLIEHGEIASPVRNFRFTQSYPQAMAPGGVLGIGSHAFALPHGFAPTSFVAPALRLASWNYTGGASG